MLLNGLHYPELTLACVDHGRQSQQVAGAVLHPEVSPGGGQPADQRRRQEMSRLPSGVFVDEQGNLHVVCQSSVMLVHCVVVRRAFKRLERNSTSRPHRFVSLSNFDFAFDVREGQPRDDRDPIVSRNHGDLYDLDHLVLAQSGHLAGRANHEQASRTCLYMPFDEGGNAVVVDRCGVFGHGRYHRRHAAVG